MTARGFFKNLSACCLGWALVVAAGGSLYGAETVSETAGATGNEASSNETGSESATAPASSSGHRFQQGEVRRYLFETKQDVNWSSAGDQLAYTSTIAIEWSCFAEQVSEEAVVLIWRVLDLRATHSGPGREHRLDSAQEIGGDDPLLGDLMVYHLVPLTVTIDPRSGSVRSVSGHQRLIDRLNQRHPAPNPLAPAPRQAAAEKAFDPLRLQQLFGRLLAVPQSGEGSTLPLDLGPDLPAAATLQWEGSRFQMTLAESDETPSVDLHTNPTPVSLGLQALSGEGETRIDESGVLQRSTGTYTMEIAGTAMTQGFHQTHEVTWQVALLALSLPEQSDSADQPE